MVGRVTLPRGLALGWTMRITATTRNIQHIAAPFAARIGDQDVELLCVNSSGDVFEGYLRRKPQAGDRPLHRLCRGRPADTGSLSRGCRPGYILIHGKASPLRFSARPSMRNSIRNPRCFWSYRHYPIIRFEGGCHGERGLGNDRICIRYSRVDFLPIGPSRF